MKNNVGDIITTKQKFGTSPQFVIIKTDDVTKARTVKLYRYIKDKSASSRRIPYSVLNLYYKVIGKHLPTVFKDL